MRHVPVLAVAAVAVAGLALAHSSCTRKYTPPERAVLVPQEQLPAAAYDVWGRAISAAEAAELMKTGQGRAMLSPANGAVRIDERLLKLGERAFYEETYANEVFMTDVLGLLAGPVKPPAITRAILALKGGGTSNLQITLDEDANVGGRQFKKGELINTGLDVPTGATAPMGMTIRFELGKVSAGVTCALCHSTVDPETKEVVHGAPNADFAGGPMIAFATNSAAYFTHADIKDLSKFVTDPTRTVEGSDGRPLPLPDPLKLEQAVDAVLMQWPPGSFDSMTDLVACPSQIPDSFTWGDHPYAWSGPFMAGPFRGLSVQSNNVHGLNSDALTEAGAAPMRFGIDKELFLAVVLQNAPGDRFRWDPSKGKPSEFFARVDPTPWAPAMNEMVTLPTHPRSTLVEPTSLWCSDPAFTVWEKMNAMAAWQNTLVPPPARVAADAATVQRGRQVFERAGCATCHSGPALTNNRIIPAPEIGTQPLRAKGMANTRHSWTWETVAYAFGQPVPLPANPRVIPVPIKHFDKRQIELAYGWGDSPGGYKVPSLIGLFWSAPYLHDGGVAVGADGTKDVGVPATSLQFERVDPYNSLRALVDRDLRQRVVDANRSHPVTKAMHVEGIGHTFWVDSGAGFSPDDQRALILYLLTYRPPADAPPPTTRPSVS